MISLLLNEHVVDHQKVTNFVVVMSSGMIRKFEMVMKSEMRKKTTWKEELREKMMG